MIKRLTALAALGLLVAGCSTQARYPLAAQPGQLSAKGRDDQALARMTEACARGMRQIFDGIDADRDVRLTRAEWDARCLGTEWWETRDANADGFVVVPEFSTLEENRSLAKQVLALCDELMAEFDANGDGVIAGPEFEGQGAVMRIYDEDQDGRATLREVQASWERFLSGETSTIIWPACPPDPTQRNRGVVFEAHGGRMSHTWLLGRGIKSRPIGPPPVAKR